MPRQARRISQSGYYHVMLRRAGKQFLFEDDADRRAFVSFLVGVCGDSSIDVVAWCLMDNHIHLVLLDKDGLLSTAVKRMAILYAQRFNRRTGHVGHVFQNRFASKPVESDAYLLDVVRYVHNNPVAAGLGSVRDYPWSSYSEYVSSVPGFVKTGVVLDMIGGSEQFNQFLEDRTRHDPGASIMRAKTDDEVRAIAWWAVGSVVDKVGELPKPERDHVLRSLAEAGLSTRQIVRLTGIGRNTITRALVART